MEDSNPVLIKSFAFSVNLLNYLKNKKRSEIPEVLKNQLFKSGTSIGANIEESMGSQSRKEFFHKISIAYREARETHYWLRIINATSESKNPELNRLTVSVEELLKLIGSIRKTTRAKLK
ncbi:MAG: four helix bundle protein [Bacteroidetes bacterium]|nr:four helix bundle protein [Bacteroidota bacterium]